VFEAVFVGAALQVVHAEQHSCPPHPTSCPLQQPQWVTPGDSALFTNVCLRAGTEYAQNRCEGVPADAGNFTCQCCGLPLFTAAAKCHSGTGWPSFTTTIGACVKSTNEVVCSRCGAHLGDYFHTAGWTADATCNLADGTPSRYCIDGVCLRPPPGTQFGQQCTVPGRACPYGQAVYFGDGCFWHTQYDLYLAERAPPFNRGVGNITARVGYAGGFGTGQNGQVCYHGGPAGTMYGDLHYAEAAQVTLDADAATAALQFEALARKYFTESFQLINGRWYRLDPGDSGADYRNVIGVPGGVRGLFYPSIVRNNVHNMTLLEGGVHGDGGDSTDNGVVYIYDSHVFPFYRGEQYHQYHPNVVLGRSVPQEYLVTAKQDAVNRGWINPDCADSNAPVPAVTNLENATTRCGVISRMDLTFGPTTFSPTSRAPTTEPPTTNAPVTAQPSSHAPTTWAPTTVAPTNVGAAAGSTTHSPTTVAPTSNAPVAVSRGPTTNAPTSFAPTTVAPTTGSPTTLPPATAAPTLEIYADSGRPHRHQAPAASDDPTTLAVCLGVLGSIGAIAVVTLMVKRRRDARAAAYSRLAVDNSVYDSVEVPTADDFDEEAPQALPLEEME